MSDHQAPSREAWLRALVTRVTGARGYKSALGGVLKRLCRGGDWSYAEAWIPTHDGRGLKMGPVFARSRTEEVVRFRQRGRGLGFLPGQGLVGQVFAAAKHRWLPSLAGRESELPRRQALARDAGFQSVAAFPVLVKDRAIAVFAFYGGAARRQDAALVEKVGVALAAVGPALDQKRVEMSVRAQARQHEVVAGIGLRALDKTTDIRLLLGDAAEIAAKTLRADAAAVLDLHDHGRLVVRAGAHWPNDAVETTIAEPYFAYVLASGRPVAVPNFRADGGFPPPSLFASLNARSAVATVVPGRSRPLGILCVVAKEPRRFPEDAFLRGLADVLGVAMERDRAERDLERERARLAAELEASHEELRHADQLRAIANLASGITHDMNNVMLPALCRLDAIEAAGLPAAAAREIEGVRGAFDKLRKLARGLQLVATNPENGVSFPASTRLETWWREIGGLLALALNRDVQLTATFPDGLPPVAAAPPQLTHAILGLVHILGEAFDGPGRILVRAEADGPRLVKLSVADASPQPLVRAIDGLERRTAGVRCFAFAAGGSLEVAPAEVALRLPVAAAAADPRPEEPALPRLAQVRLKDARAAAFVTSLLSSAGFEVASRSEQSVLAVWDGSEDPAEIRRYLGENTSRRVLLLGAPESPAPRGASVVSEPGNLEAVRRTLGMMVEELLEITDDSIRTDTGAVRR